MSGTPRRARIRPPAFLQRTLCAVLAFGWGCDGPGDYVGPEDSPLPGVAVSVAISPDSASLIEGDSIWLSATAYDGLGDVVSGHAPTWSVEDPYIAFVDGEGMLRGIRSGVTTVTATISNVSQSAPLVVIPFEEPGLLALGDTMAGYLAPGAKDSIGLELPRADLVQLRASGSSGHLIFALHLEDGAIREHLMVLGSGQWYSSVYLGAAPADFVVSLSALAPRGVHYTFAADSIATGPEHVPAQIELSDTVRGEVLGPPNGDRDTFWVQADSTAWPYFRIRFGPEWEGHKLHVSRIGEIDPQEGEGWLTRDFVPVRPGENDFQFRVQDPVGQGLALPLEFVFEPIELPEPLATLEWPFRSLSRSEIPDSARIELYYNGYYNDAPCDNANTTLGLVTVGWGVPDRHRYDASDPGFSGFVACLTNGTDETLAPGIRQLSGWAVEESRALDKSPAALGGTTVEFIDLVVDGISVVGNPGSYTVQPRMRWLFYGG